MKNFTSLSYVFLIAEKPLVAFLFVNVIYEVVPVFVAAKLTYFAV